ncbi:PucR family transcriptional regulator [Actinomadura rupiterrae]|uniref:PucR family transcriptional regulator n=1 Tax=Actinomadura rupiterrae TaxID=559627 RepID=UPI0020A3D010|nr:PucR family transcriptional regulator [Actinomadura rupiterrae]MCP2342123.1 sugar diacid utilization regulator [Actinomadura rupiterrae]
MSPIEERLSAHLPELTRAAVEACRREVPFYRSLPPELLTGEVADSFADAGRLFLDLFVQRRLPNGAELTEVIERSARRAADGVPLDAALSAYLITMITTWDWASATADTDEMRRYGSHTLRFLASVLPALILAHLSEQQLIENQRRDIRGELIRALLSGKAAHALAEQSGVPLAPGYRLLLLRLRLGSADAHRAGRRLQAALDAHQQTDVLADCTADPATVLLPADASGDLSDLVAGLEESIGCQITAAVADAPTLPEIPEAFSEAAQVVDLASRLGLPPGLYRLEDVLIEYQLARPGRAFAALTACLEPLEENPTLLQTAEAFVRHGHNRSRTADELRIHRNTLDYRLTRVAKLTGLDLSSARGLQHLDAAILVGRLRHQ